MSSGLPSRHAFVAPIVGIVGGIGSGKSSVARNVRGLNLQILDADRIGHELLLDAEISRQIQAHFGSEVVDEHGTIIRARLAKLVFGPSEEQQTRKRDLERILHPRIRKAIEEKIEATPHDADVIILDAALLLEAGWYAVCDALIFIDTPRAIREARVIRDRGWSVDELRRREATQFPIKRKRDAADFIVDNSGPIEAAAEAMGQVLRRIIEGKQTGTADGR